MASSSSSSSLIQRSFKYDVFLSFRGEDTRNNFVGHLYEALLRNCIETYKDDEKIDKGERINDQLLKSIQDSRFYIIVFSKNYASSSWCLDELVKIIECQKMTEHTAFPVFYDVEPTEVRKQSGAVEKAFADNKKKEAAGKWREAMEEASNLAGWELKATANGDESKLIQMIVHDISIKKHSTLSNADEKLVGMETRISDVLSSLEIGIEDVRMIGIKGMGGGGKTTLARAVYDQISNRFEGKSFVENVREVSKSSSSGLKKLQKRILKDVLNEKDITFGGVHDGKNMLKDMMSRRKILVVLDDVDCIEQLEALVGEPNWFKSGSRLIITTRDEQVLLAHRVNFVHDVNLLSSTEAICLFSRYAFQTEIPTREYEELSGKVVQYAHGLPLTIKVLGSFLCDQKDSEWIDVIKRLKTIPLKATMEKLELSYNGLEEDYKEIFLDVACILKGWDKEDAIMALESRGFRAKIGLRVLEQRSLITYDRYGRLGMHDHLEEMGRNIVRRSHPDEPQRHSRLWIKEEIEYILLTNDRGNPATKCLRFYLPGFSAEIAIKGLAKMKDLTFLYIRVSDRCDDKVSEYLPSSLRFMKWDFFSLPSLPNTFQGENLVGLELGYSKIIQLWEDGEEKVLYKLRFLKIKHSKLRTFDLRLAPNLEQLTIEDCYDFEELHIPADHHSKLEHLELANSKLKTIHLGSTPNLEELTLKGCNDLVELEMPAKSLKLKKLNLSHSKLMTIHLGSTPNLEELTLESCNCLVELEMPVESLKLKKLNLSHSKLKTIHLGSTPNLEELTLEGCNDLVELHMPAEIPKLEYLDLSHSKLKSLHLGNTSNLKKLKVKGCNDLVELHMPAEILKLEYLNLSHLKLKSLRLGNTPNVKKLKVKGCNDLVELEMPVESLKLAFIDLRRSKLTNLHLGSTPNLEELTLYGCNDLVELEMPVESLKLKKLNLSHSKLKTIHLRSTPNLEELTLRCCNDLVELEMPSESLKLKKLNLSHSKLKTIHLGSTPNLEELTLYGCHDLVELEMPVESLKLKKLNLSHSKLKTIHLGSTPNLEELTLDGCNDLVELEMPAESLKLKKLILSDSKLKTIHLGSTPNLEELTLYGCHDLVELEIPSKSLKLAFIDLRGSKLTNLHLGSTPNLEELRLDGCNDLVELQMPAESLKLARLNLSHSKLKIIHLGSTPNLEELTLDDCNDLSELQMPAESLKLAFIDLNHSKLTTLDLGLTPNLKWLKLKNCYDLVEINAPVGCLRNLASLDLSGCGSFKSFLFDKWSQPASAGSLSELHLIAEPTDVCPLHSDNDSPKFQFSCYYKEHRASSFGNLERIISLGLCPCTTHESFSRSICSLQGIKKLTLEGSITEAPRDLDQLEHLKCLEIKSCWLLEKLPDDIGRLESLEMLILTDCKLLQDIPNSICKMKCINSFDLRGCIRVVELPEEIGCLEGLKELNIKGTGITRLPQSIFKLRGLRIVGSIRLLDTHGLLLKRRRTSDDDEIVCYI
ncbi:Toll/interleukin-1 receptor domain-containing protein [Tanacetum coccineum]